MNYTLNQLQVFLKVTQTLSITKAAEELLAIGQSPRDKALDPLELAAHACVANVILNLDEVMTRE